VPARCVAQDVVVNVPGGGKVTGDIAWGGNWFYILHHDAVPLTLQNAGLLTRFTQAIQDQIRADGIGANEGWAIDHIEISGDPTGPTLTAGTSCSVPAASTTARPAALAPRPRWRCSTPGVS
jgi:proline racemase